MVDEIIAQEPKAERSLMHRFNIALVQAAAPLSDVYRLDSDIFTYDNLLWHPLFTHRLLNKAGLLFTKGPC